MGGYVWTTDYEGHLLETCFHADAAGVIRAQRGLKQRISWHLPLTTFLPISSVTPAGNDLLMQSMDLNVLFILKWQWQL